MVQRLQRKIDWVWSFFFKKTVTDTKKLFGIYKAQCHWLSYRVFYLFTIQAVPVMPIFRQILKNKWFAATFEKIIAPRNIIRIEYTLTQK